MKEYYLSELLELKYGKDHKTLGNGTIPCYGSGGVIRYVNNSLYEKESILIPRKGSLNNLFFINKPFWTVDTLFWSIINEKIVLPRYLFYKLKNLNLSSFNEGSAVPSLTTKTLNKISIKIHDLKLQEKIVSILSLLDEKIELNKKINQNLEETAQTLFKRWFIDFEFPNEEGKPYKSNGGKMIESELGEIPEGWRVGKLANYFSDIISGDWGKELPQNNYIEEVNCIKGADIIDITKGNKNKVVKRFILSKNFKNKKLQHGDLIVEISGGSPTQSTGRITYVNSEILKKLDNKVITTNFCKVLRLKNHILYPYIYLYWKYFYLNNLFFQFENGTTGIKNLDINSILNSENLFIIPCDNIISLFSKIIDIKFTFIQKKGNEIEKLIELRDYLLPRLMSGKIDVSNLKIFEILNSDLSFYLIQFFHLIKIKLKQFFFEYLPLE